MTEVAALPTFAAAAPGQRAILEGALSPAVPILKQGYVVMKRRGPSRSGRWQIWTPPVSVVTSSGVVDIVNDTYVPDPWLVTWGHESRDDSEPMWTIEGLFPNREIMAVGHVVEQGRFSAETISAGPRAHYLDAVAARSASAGASVWLYLLLGPLLLTYGLWDVVRIAREP